MKFELNDNLNESNNFRRVKQSLWGDPTGKIRTFAIVSPESPLAWENATDEEIIERYRKWLNNPKEYNLRASKGLKANLIQQAIMRNGDTAVRYSGCNFAKIKGKYGNVEHSLMIFNITKADVETIARDYGQESFFFANVYPNHSHIAYYKTTNVCKTYKLVEVTDVVTEEDGNDFFSKYGFKFRINLNEFGDDVLPIENNGEFEESLNETRTFMSRAMHRREAYKKK